MGVRSTPRTLDVPVWRARVVFDRAMEPHLLVALRDDQSNAEPALR
jgi:hypothetical protein